MKELHSMMLKVVNSELVKSVSGRRLELISDELAIATIYSFVRVHANSAYFKRQRLQKTPLLRKLYIWCF